jgi:hypothetical protein
MTTTPIEEGEVPAGLVYVTAKVKGVSEASPTEGERPLTATRSLSGARLKDPVRDGPERWPVASPVASK